jgi:hypothetical protein
MKHTNGHASYPLESAGRRALLAAAIAVLLIGTDAAGIVLAQYTSSPAASSQDRLRAPIGHRQPRAQDLPPKVADQEGARSEADRQLDRALNSICRGC